ncbi:hypothetical protein [Micropruina sp.]|uniref:hypothetical protein n=1 Tax=Micropruina sp. TaxID=2737536 RepID=UPI0039E67122
MPAVEALPSNVRLFHVGPPKTGTTALQAALAASREDLVHHGVVYPGTGYNHRYEVAAVVGKTIGWKTRSDGRPRKPPSIERWNRLVDEVRSHPHQRVVISHEYAAGAGVQAAQRIRDDMGESLHVLVTLRSHSLMLPSIWQETNKAAGNRGTFDRWLKAALEPGSDINQLVRRRHAQGELIRRWAKVVGPENVTAIILDPNEHGMVYRVVEQLLALPDGLLARSDTHAWTTNRSMTVPELELFRQFNRRFRAENTTWRQYDALLIKGGLERVLGSRTPAQCEPRLTMPDWAAEQADRISVREAEEVVASGVRVIGDPAHLMQPAKRRTDAAEDHRQVSQVPIDLAVEAMVGISAAALLRDARFSQPHPTALGVMLQQVPARELLAELGRRGRRGTRRWTRLGRG